MYMYVYTMLCNCDGPNGEYQIIYLFKAPLFCAQLFLGTGETVIIYSTSGGGFQISRAHAINTLEPARAIYCAHVRVGSKVSAD